MPDFAHLLLFMAAGWLLNVAPGPDVQYIVTNSLRSGPRACIVDSLIFLGFGLKLALSDNPCDH